ncbi:hypothetical protein ACWEGE_05885 [Amycolatopsis sp. NPDC004747]
MVDFDGRAKGDRVDVDPFAEAAGVGQHGPPALRWLGQVLQVQPALLPAHPPRYVPGGQPPRRAVPGGEQVQHVRQGAGEVRGLGDQPGEHQDPAQLVPPGSLRQRGPLQETQRLVPSDPDHRQAVVVDPALRDRPGQRVGRQDRAEHRVVHRQQRVDVLGAAGDFRGGGRVQPPPRREPVLVVDQGDLFVAASGGVVRLVHHQQLGPRAGGAQRLRDTLGGSVRPHDHPAAGMVRGQGQPCCDLADLGRGGAAQFIGARNTRRRRRHHCTPRSR